MNLSAGMYKTYPTGNLFHDVPNGRVFSDRTDAHRGKYRV